MINLNSPGRRQAARVLLRLRTPENQALLGLISELAEEAKESLVGATDTVIIHRLQGRAGAFKDLLEAVDDAAKVTERSTP